MEINTSARTAKRKQQKSLGSSVVSYLIELITNADDSYRRLESKGLVNKDLPKPIYIILEEKRGNTQFSVIDNAEGMSSSEVKTIFSKYGADTADGDISFSRGIFGQGATDVMINAAMDSKVAMLESIKEGDLCRFYFCWNNETGKKTLDEKQTSIRNNQMDQLRTILRIPNNGTKMTFEVPSMVKYKRDKLREELESESSLRYILCAENRNVILVHKSNEIKLNSSRYLLTGEVLFYKEFSFEYDSIDLHCTLELRRNKNKRDEGDNKTEIIVTDSSQRVFANTMFGYAKMSKAKDISGTLIIDGLYDLCKKHLNQEHPDEIINDDRSGFNEKTDFYKNFLVKKYLDKYIMDCLNEHGVSVSEVDITKHKKFRSVLSAVNKWMSEELKRNIPGGGGVGTSPPSNGLSFQRKKIEITKGASYDLKFIINPNLIGIEDDIFVDVFGNENDYITVTPDVIAYDEEEIKDGIVIKSISINAIVVTENDKFATITISSKNYSDSIAVYVREADIFYPENGISFDHQKVIYTQEGNHKSTVWFDTSMQPLNTNIIFECDGMKILNNDIKLSQEMLVTDTIGKFNVVVYGGVLGNNYHLIGKANDINFEQLIQIRDISKEIRGTNGLITGFKLWPIEGDESFQVTFQEKTGIIYINPFSPINISFMGDMSDINPDNPKFKESQMNYIVELISLQAAIIDVKELERKNYFTVSDRDILESYWNEINKKKLECFKRMSRAMLD